VALGEVLHFFVDQEEAGDNPSHQTEFEPFFCLAVQWLGHNRAGVDEVII
jgi:hypothetical protein